jgi:hypothetical protein
VEKRRGRGDKVEDKYRRRGKFEMIERDFFWNFQI